MAEYMKHIGRLKNTDQRCVIVFMQMPGLEDHALVINTEALPPRYEAHLMEVLESPEGQASQDLAQVMSRRFMPETQRDLLNDFHFQGYLRREPIDNIILFPRPNMPFALRDVLTKMGRSVPERMEPIQPTRAQIEEIYSSDPSNSEAARHKFNPYTNNQGAASAEHSLGIANNMLIDAQLLEEEASRKRQEAYRLAPELRPDPLGKAMKGRVADVSIDAAAKRPAAKSEAAPK